MRHSSAYGPLDVGLDAQTAFGGLSGRLTVDLLCDARGVAVKLDGELDLATAPELDRELARIEVTQVTRLLINLSGVTFMDSTGLQSIVRAHHFAESNHHTLVLRRGTRQVQRRFELSGIDERLTFEDDWGPLQAWCGQRGLWSSPPDRGGATGRCANRAADGRSSSRWAHP